GHPAPVARRRRSRPGTVAQRLLRRDCWSVSAAIWTSGASLTPTEFNSCTRYGSGLSSITQLTKITGMRQVSFADFHCSLARSLDLIGDWWTPLIIRDLSLGLHRFDELATNLGISRNLLTTRLKTLVEANIVE